MMPKSFILLINYVKMAAVNSTKLAGHEELLGSVQQEKIINDLNILVKKVDELHCHRLVSSENRRYALLIMPLFFAFAKRNAFSLCDSQLNDCDYFLIPLSHNHIVF